jgi:dTDP-4-dehydrorhamnose reductase
VAPLGVYGRTKAAGEAAVAASGAAHLILRTAWLYDARGHNFFRTIRRLARERAVLRVVDDQRGAPTWAVQVALAVSQMLAVVGTDPGTRRAVTGTYHLAAAGEATWYDFATAIVEALRLRETVAVERVEAIPTTAWPTPARRPAYSVLDCEAAAKAFGVRLPDWREGLALLQATLDETGDLP